MAKENVVRFMQRIQILEPNCDIMTLMKETPVANLMSEASDYNLPFSEKDLKEVLEAC